MPRQAGVIVYTEKGTDNKVEVFLVQCVHCGGQFPPVPSKGRGYCMKCGGPVCGRGCAKCVPEDLLLENMEKGRPLDYRPIIA